MPPEGHQFGSTQAMAKQHEDNGRITHWVAPGFAGCLHHGVDLLRAEIVALRGPAGLFPWRGREAAG